MKTVAAGKTEVRVCTLKVKAAARLLLGLAASVSFLTVGMAGAASPVDEYPAKPIKLVVMFPAGGSSDILGRQLASEMSKSIGQPVIVDNRPGAAGNIGSTYVAKAPKDGYTLLLGSLAAQAINVTMYESMPYDVLRDLEPISMVASLTPVLAANSKLAAHSVKELVAFAKARPGGLKYASAGRGSSQHLAAEWFGHMAGIEMLHVPYKGDGPGIVDLIAGRVDIQFSLVTASLRHIRSGSLRPLAVGTAKRSPLLPDVPTFGEAGYPDFIYSSWVCLFAPGGTPAAVVQTLNREVVKAVKSPTLSSLITTGGAEPVTSSPDELRAFVKSEIEKWGEVVKRSGVKVNE